MNYTPEQKIVSFCMDNFQDDFLYNLEIHFPELLARDWYNQRNDRVRFTKQLAEYLKADNRYIVISNLVFKYDENAGNWTNSDKIHEFIISLPGNHKNALMRTKSGSDDEEKPGLFVKIKDLFNGFGGFLSGKQEEEQTQTTTKVEKKTNWGLVAGVIVSLITISFGIYHLTKQS
jgi:hypothetical protein